MLALLFAVAVFAIVSFYAIINLFPSVQFYLEDLFSGRQGKCKCFKYVGKNCWETGRSDGKAYTRVSTQCTNHTTRSACEGARKGNSVPFCKWHR